MITAFFASFFPAGGLVAKVASWLWSKLTLKNIAIFIVLAVLAFGQYRFYGWAKGNGIAQQAKADKAQIDTLTVQRNNYKQAYEDYRTAYETWQARSAQARKELIDGNKKIVDAIESRLKAEQAHSAELARKLKHDLPQYIPPAVDTFLPRGFVRVWNDSLDGETGTAPAGQAGLAYGLGDDAPRASDLKLSAFASIGIDNNQECVIRGQVIREWQGWYYDHKELFEKVQKQAMDDNPMAKLPVLTPPATPVPAHESH